MSHTTTTRAVTTTTQPPRPRVNGATHRTVGPSPSVTGSAKPYVPGPRSTRPAVSFALLGLFLGASGLVVVLLQVGLGDLSVAVLTDRTRPFVYRGAAVTASGIILLAVAVVVWSRDVRL